MWFKPPVWVWIASLPDSERKLKPLRHSGHSPLWLRRNISHYQLYSNVSMAGEYDWLSKEKVSCEIPTTLPPASSPAVSARVITRHFRPRHHPPFPVKCRRRFLPRHHPPRRHFRIRVAGVDWENIFFWRRWPMELQKTNLNELATKTRKYIFDINTRRITLEA